MQDGPINVIIKVFIKVLLVREETNMKKLTLLFIAILTALLLASPVYAADIRLSSSCSLADAIIAANGDRAEGDCPAGRGADTITLTRDITLDSDLPKITSDIIIEGEGYTISGDNRWRIFYNEGGALTIKNLTMTKGYVEGELIRDEDGTLKVAPTANSIGGAVYNEGELIIINSIIAGNSSDISGGAIYNGSGTVSIINSSFSGNSADEAGGAIYNRSGTVSISDSAFSGNSADEKGGAIYNWQEGELSIANSSFSGNSAIWGGAIFNWHEAELSIGGSAFSGNSADDAGGAILHEEHGELSVSDSSFSGNSAGISGGAVYSKGELSVSDSIFSGNSADREGGAIANGGELSVSINGNTFSGNSADERGGAIVNWGELSVSDSSFSSNSAGISGGAIYNRSGTVSINGNTFSGNSADERGGAIHNEGGLSIGNSTFSGNSAIDGGAIHNRGELSISDSTFNNNSADKAGGAIYEEEGELIMVNSIIAGNGGDACYSARGLRHNISNFIQDGSCSPAFSGDPMLGELVAPEDGSPAYFPLLAGSPAIDAADDRYCLETDQIGAVRPQGAGCDIGAIEYTVS